jgi:phospholipid/cholesterol/gamma-HCH transport system substrate-binding protein
MDIISLIGTMNQVGEDVKDISAKLNKTTDDLNTVIMNVNDIVGDEGFKSNIKGSASNFNVASKNLDLLLEENRHNLSVLTSKLNSLADNLENTVTDTKPDLKETITNVRSLTIKLDSLTDNFNQLVSNTKDTNSTIGKLLTDDEFYVNLNNTVVNIDKLIKQIKKEGLKLKIF